MHFEVLIEDRSGAQGLQHLLPKILGPDHSFRVHHYRGIGRLPSGLRTEFHPKKKMLLNQLPRLIQGYGKTFANYPGDYEAAVVCICDLDNRCRHDFRQELLQAVENLHPRPTTYFCIAEEEGEAWMLGDHPAILAAFPAAKRLVLENYVPDSICGTWERLADAIHTGGSKALKKRQHYEIGAAKCTWADKISPEMNVEVNDSPSFQYFRDKLREAISE